jgi:hypothetical protein
MVTRFCVSVLMTCSVSFSQSPVNLSGTVKNRLTGSAISGATVSLRGQPLTTTTNPNGEFSLAGTTGVIRPSSGQGLSNPEAIEFRHDDEGSVRIRIIEPNGKQRAVVHSGFLSRGTWSVVPPALEPGVYFCTFDSPSSHRSIRFLSSGKSDVAHAGSLAGVGIRPEPDVVSARSYATTVVDTLLVTKNGFRPVAVSLANLVQTGLVVLLDDSASIDVEKATIVPDPSWPCYMAAGIPPPSLGTAAFSITLQIGAVHDVGMTKFGKRRQYDINGGAVTGDKFAGTVLAGGLDYELTLSNGSTEIEQINIIKANNIPILMRNAGVTPNGGTNARVVLDFEAPNSSSYAWLNTGKFAAMRIVDTVAKTIRLDVYDISKVTLPTTTVRIKDPVGATNQTWDCVILSGGQGATVFTETVTLGSSISIGASKRGSRNIIPITGGTTTGKVVGKVLSGGADYQLSGLDARYTLAPNDGEFILVRNCGANGLVPVFEARVDGPYAFLNEVKYLSSSPNMVGSGVSITFYEKK